MTFGFTTAEDKSGSAAPAASGASGYVGAMMTDAARAVRKQVGLWATVTNTTHYDVNMGFVQILDSVFSLASFTKGTGDLVSATNALDDLATWQSYFYQDFSKVVPQGATVTLGGPNNVPYDSPSYAGMPMTNGQGWLITMCDYSQFSTSVAVCGGQMSPGGDYILGYPIGLSTAQWHVAISATNVGNKNAPSDANLSSTSNMSLWQASLGIGNGPMPSQLPGANVPWSAPGDGKSRYLSWSTDWVTASGAAVGQASPVEGVLLLAEPRREDMRPRPPESIRSLFAVRPHATWHRRPPVARRVVGAISFLPGGRHHDAAASTTV